MDSNSNNLHLVTMVDNTTLILLILNQPIPHFGVLRPPDWFKSCSGPPIIKMIYMYK